MGGEFGGSEAYLHGGLASVDPTLSAALAREDERQVDKLVMIASESICPPAVREALSSSLTSIYAEGYPARRTLQVPESLAGDLDLQIAYHRRYGDRRYYKGTDYANVVEALAQRRVAEIFASSADPAILPEAIYANVQALSGAAANNAAYAALIEPGDTIMGLDLTHGGHLTHGSPVNRSGRYYRVAAYGVNPETGRIDYEALAATARDVRPKVIVAGASAFPWDIDWHRLRQIADSLPERARLLADISHPAGLVVAGLFPNPIGYADVVTFTTHKTLLGPRSAAILTTDAALARKIDQAVFPGEQGGPHLNTIAAMAVCFGIARTAEFRALQSRIVENARALGAGLTKRGLELAYGGTNTHLLLIDLKSVRTDSDLPLNGDLASRILDVAGIVCNKNTIAGDTSAFYPSGLRLGTTWLTQRGFGPAEMDRVANVVHRVLTGVKTFTYPSNARAIPRGRIEPSILAEARREVAELVGAASETGSVGADRVYRLVRGPRAAAFLQAALSSDVLALEEGQATSAFAFAGETRHRVVVARASADASGTPLYLLAAAASEVQSLEAWLRDLSDGYVALDPSDLLAKVDGPVAISSADVELVAELAEAIDEAWAREGGEIAPRKPFFVGQTTVVAPAAESPKAEFSFDQHDGGAARRTPLYEEHVRLGARLVPFAGYEMPIWYSSIGEEHLTVRTAAGLFDLAHMGVLEVSGPGACRFLDVVTTNYVSALDTGKAQYSYLLDAAGHVLDDILIYRRGDERYMLVVNASNAEKVLAWLNAVAARAVVIDLELPQREVDATPLIRDLRDPAAGDERRVDIAVQGPRSLDVLRAAIGEGDLAERIARLGKFAFVEGEIAGIPSLVSRTGYTGERIGYEIYVSPDRAVELWRLLLAVGAEHGLKPIGLGARDSLRTEAGFPLYGHELAGEHDISPMGAGYGGFVKLHKPFFVGRRALIEREGKRRMAVVRYRMDGRGGRVIRSGDPVVNRRGEYIGRVTSGTAIEGVQFGLAYVDRGAAETGTPIAIFPLSAAPRGRPEKAKAELGPGDRVLLPEAATVQPRFA